MSEKPRGWTPRVIEGGKNEQSKDVALETESESVQTTHEHLISKPGSTLRSDLEYFLGDMNRLKNASDRMEEITEFIFDRLKGFVKNDANIDLRRQGLANTKMEDLAEHILNSKESDWKTQPSFYGAAILEYQSRIDRMREVSGANNESGEA